MLVHLQLRWPRVSASLLEGTNTDAPKLSDISHRLLNQQYINKVLGALISAVLARRLRHPVNLLSQLVVQGQARHELGSWQPERREVKRLLGTPARCPGSPRRRRPPRWCSTRSPHHLTVSSVRQAPFSRSLGSPFRWKVNPPFARGHHSPRRASGPVPALGLQYRERLGRGHPSLSPSDEDVAPVPLLLSRSSQRLLRSPQHPEGDPTASCMQSNPLPDHQQRPDPSHTRALPSLVYLRTHAVRPL